MKTFLNVLYRRILYKVPLKWLLILIAIFGLLFASFSSADFTCNPISAKEVIYRNGSKNTYTFEWDSFGNLSDSVCIINDSSTQILQYNFNNSNTFEELNIRTSICYSKNELPNENNVYVKDKGGTVVDLGILYYPKNCIGAIMTSLQCQTEYNLIPISSVDSNYCTSNNLCPLSDCPSYTGDLTPGVSNVWINDLFHPGAYNIVMNISEEIDWDYAYTNSGNNLNIDVVGYNVDYEAVQSVIDQQNYKPTQEDFQNLILLLGPYGKIIIFFVFLFILWAWIKKPFKSKL